MAQRVAGELYESITGQLFELGRQLRQSNGYPFDPEQLKRHLQQAIVGKFASKVIEGKLVPTTISATAKVWKTWKTIKLGIGFRTTDDFRKAIKSARMKIGEEADYILGKPSFTVAESFTEVELVACSVAELGFNDGTTRKDIYIRAEELGLDLCPPEVGPQLRLQYTDQPMTEALVIAMEPITDSDDDLSLFRVVHAGDGRWLHVSRGLPDFFWDGNDRFVFLRRK